MILAYSLVSQQGVSKQLSILVGNCLERLEGRQCCGSHCTAR